LAGLKVIKDFNKFKKTYKNHDSKKQLLHKAGRILRFIFATNSAIWFEKDLSEKSPSYKANFPIEINTTSTSETIKWLKSLDEDWVIRPQEIPVAIKFGHCWISARTNRKIIGCIKIGFRNVYIADYNKVIKFPDKMAFIYDTYVLPEYRKKGVGKYLITQAINFLKTRGYTRVGCHIPPWNKASICAYEKTGFKKINYIRYFRFFGIPLLIASNNKKFSMFRNGKITKKETPYE